MHDYLQEIQQPNDVSRVDAIRASIYCRKLRPQSSFSAYCYRSILMAFVLMVGPNVSDWVLVKALT
jgi:hypothetical protein